MPEGRLASEEVLDRVREALCLFALGEFLDVVFEGGPADPQEICAVGLHVAVELNGLAALGRFEDGSGGQQRLLEFLLPALGDVQVSVFVDHGYSPG
jgi:hypothetical protein